jgi:hypothetical protein
MGDSDSAEQTFDLAENRMRGIRRVWKWGIGFWIVAWIYSALVIKLGISFYIGGFDVLIGVSSGSLYVGYHPGLTASGIEWNPPEFVFSEYHWERFMAFPDDLFRMLGRVGMPDLGYGDYFAFPMAGVLWFWLLLGWTAGFKKFEWLKFFKSLRTLARMFILVGLPLLISFSEYRGQVAEETSACMLQMRAIQQAVRGHQGMNNVMHGPLDWDDIIGPKGYHDQEYAKCPSGLPYRLSNKLPDIGDLAAECQNPEHLRRLKYNGQTQTW